MTVSFYWPPFPEISVDHYNIYKSDHQDEPTFEKIGDVVQEDELLLSFTEDVGFVTDTYRIASALRDNTELMTSPEFSLVDLVGKTRLFGRCLDLALNPVPLIKVEVALSVPQAVQHGTILPRSASTYTDEAGNWHIDLVPNGLLIPAGTKYLVQFDGGRGGKTEKVVLPTGATLIYYPSLVSL